MEVNMFIVLLVVNFIVAFIVCLIIAKIFREPINRILQRLVTEDLHSTWSMYIIYAIYVVGISGGVRVWDLEKYITPNAKDGMILQLTPERWVLEIYRTVIGTLQSNARMLLVFFIFTLVALVIVKGAEIKKTAEAIGIPTVRHLVGVL